MLAGSYYFELLGVPKSASREEIKKAYLRKVRENHPDLFPEEKRKIQEIRMIEIIEAYKRLSESPEDKEAPSVGVSGDDTPLKADSQANRAIAQHKDPGYIYYKKGLEYYQLAVHRSFTPRDYTEGLLKNNFHFNRFMQSICNLRLADSHFSRVVTDYPTSVWAPDSRAKIHRIEELHQLYRTIINNFSQGDQES